MRESWRPLGEETAEAYRWHVSCFDEKPFGSGGPWMASRRLCGPGERSWDRGLLGGCWGLRDLLPRRSGVRPCCVKQRSVVDAAIRGLCSPRLVPLKTFWQKKKKKLSGGGRLEMAGGGFAHCEDDNISMLGWESHPPLCCARFAA